MLKRKETEIETRIFFPRNSKKPEIKSFRAIFRTKWFKTEREARLFIEKLNQKLKEGTG